MDISWYIHRMKAMSLGEVYYRFRRLLWQIGARLFRRRWERYYSEQVSNTTRIVDRLESINFFGMRSVTKDDIPQAWQDNTIAIADDLLNHLYSLFALERIDLGRQIPWNRELKRGLDLPLEFAPWMDYRDSRTYGDSKYFWELGRFQHLITLAKAFYLTGSDKYAEEVVSQIRSFVDACPYLLGIHWTMAMETGLRLVSLSWIVVFLRDYLIRDAQACALIEHVIASHMEYTSRNYSYYSSANNHLIGEAAGVFIAGICFGRNTRQRKQTQRAHRILRDEIQKQFYPDGVNREQTTHYHISCFNLFLLAGLLGRANGLDFPESYWQRLEKAAEFIYALSNDDHSIINIGDSDDGKTINLSESGYNQVQSLLTTTAVLFQRSDFKTKAGCFDEMSYWLLGSSGRQVYNALQGSLEVPAVSSFAEGGYYIVHGTGPAKTKLVIDCGPLGFGTLAAHGHADTLSFQLRAYDRDYFMDPGTYIYEVQNPYRNYFRSTRAHNTLVVDGRDQSEMTGPFLWGKKANAHLEQWEDNDQYIRFIGWHDGYRRLADPVIHRRTILFHKAGDCIQIIDDVEAQSSHNICLMFHLAPECEIEHLTANHWRILNNSRSIELKVDDRLSCEWFRGSTDPICGWISRSYDKKSPAYSLACRHITHGGEHYSTEILL